MKFTYAWLKEHLDTKARVEKIADTLTRIGLEVEELFDPSVKLAPFRVAEVVKCEKHPNADKLSVCEVDTGKERLQVVCGAPNARAGMKGVFAPVGAYVPGIDLTLTKAKIRGVESNGMLLSERELELSDEHTGIIELDPKAKVGSPAAAALGLHDRGCLAPGCRADLVVLDADDWREIAYALGRRVAARVLIEGRDP